MPMPPAHGYYRAEDIDASSPPITAERRRRRSPIDADALAHRWMTVAQY